MAKPCETGAQCLGGKCPECVPTYEFECPRCGHCCQQKEWVGLTEQELGLFVYDNPRDKRRYEKYGRKIEEILKEKNT